MRPPPLLRFFAANAMLTFPIPVRNADADNDDTSVTTRNIYQRVKLLLSKSNIVKMGY